MRKEDWQIESMGTLTQILALVYSDLTQYQKSIIRKKLWLLQDKLCPICFEELDLKTCCLDHNHRTGFIRGVLCKDCNVGLGCFDDNKHILREAIKYITSSFRHEEITYVTVK